MALWTMRLVWFASALAAPWASWNDASDPVRTVAAAWGWTSWSVVMVASGVALPVSLTVVRLATPVVLALTAGAWVVGVGDHGVRTAAGTALVVLGATVAARAEVATAMVGGGAYGNEVRLPLRTPVPHLAPAAVSWTVCVAACVGGSLLVAARVAIPGGLACLAGAGLALVVPRRLHVLSRRWLVKVPAGLVVHDHLVLAEALMIKRHDVSGVATRDSPGPEADLTGGVVGLRLVVELSRPATVTLAPVTTRMLGVGPALHVSSFAVAPVRAEDAAHLLGPPARS